MADLRIPDPNEPPFNHNLSVSDNEDIKMLILLIEGLRKQIGDLENRIQQLEFQKMRRRLH